MTAATIRRAMQTAGLLAVLFAVFGSSQDAQAQPQLNFKRIINNWPTIELYFSVGCNGQPAYFTDKRYFKVVENGIEIGEFELWCPDPTMRCAISVALVFDASGSMGGSGNAGAKAAGNAFVDMMDGTTDEGAVIWFNTAVNVVQGMTTSLDMLHSAINSLPASGGTAVWDGIYAGVLELINNGVNQCRAVIAMTDGQDNSSSRGISEIISLANRNRVRIFTIGLGSGINGAQLSSIANLTGGRYYEAPSAAQLVAIYQEISTIMFQGFQECLITYTAKCMDGSTRTVDLTLLNFCGGSDTKTKTYKALRDTSTFIPLKFRLGTTEARGNATVVVPLELLDPIMPKDIFYPAIITVLYDENCAQFVNIKTPPGSLLEGVPITITPIAGGVIFETMDRKVLEVDQVPAILAELTFKTSDPDGKDTVCCPLKLASWAFSAGCFKPVLIDGEICIIPRQPDVSCTISAPPFLSWVRTLKDYAPNPFTVGMTLSNIGDREARKAMFKIIYNKSDLSLVAPLNDTQFGTPKNVDPAGLSEARWDVMAKRRLTGDSVQVCIQATFENHPMVECCTKIWIPPADAVLECDVTAPVIVADKVTQKYNPMPFTVDLIVTNSGGRKTDSVFATIIVPRDLILYGPDAPDKNTKRILPAMLSPGQQGGVSWTLWHPITLDAKTYKVGVWVKTSNADSTYCEVEVVIPPLEAPVLSPRCSTPDSLHFDTNIDAYIPNPFQVTLTCVNRGGLPASNVTGYIYLPANVEFVDPLEVTRKTFNPSTMNEYQGGPVPILTWLVRYTKKLRYDTYLDFRFMVGGLGPTGIPTDSVEVWCRVRVPGLAPSFACSMTLPDSLSLNATETDVEPNPFTAVYKVWNTSKQTAMIKTVDLNYPYGDDLYLDISTPKTINPNRTLAPGDTLTVTWLMTAKNRITRRYVTIFAVAYDDEGNPVICTDAMPIANLKTSLICSATTTEPVIRYIPITQEYTPTTWVISATLVNTGGAAISDITAEIELADSTLAQYVAFDPSFPDNTNPKTLPALFPQSNRTFQWGFRLAAPNMTGVSVYPIFNIKYGSLQTPFLTSGCDVPVEIMPVVMPVLECKLQAPDTIWFNTDRYEPSPFELKLQVSNTGNGDAENVVAYVIQDTRFNIIPPSSLDFGTVNAFSVRDFASNDGFDLKVNPRQTDGYDTVRVMVMADGIPSTMCAYPIYVMHEQRPVFEMICEANPKSLTFNDQLNDYVPNPFEVTTTAINMGDTRADNCQLVFVGPPRFTPVDNMPIIDVGTGGVMNVGDTVTHTWKLNALKRLVGGTDTIVYQIQGRGGMGHRLIIGECRVLIYVPPARAAEYQMVCTTTPDVLVFDNASGVYVPDPFTFTARVTNAGLAEGQNLDMTALLPPGLIFANGETATKPIGNLAIGDWRDVSWLLRPIAITSGPGQTLKITAQVKDVFGKTGECMSTVYVPPATKAALGIVCATEYDTLRVDRQRGTYEDNPFYVTAKVSNTGDRPANNVKVVVLPASNELRVLGDPERFVALTMPPNWTMPDTISWNVYAVSRSVSGWIDVRFVVTADGLPSRECVAPIYVPAVGKPKLVCESATTMACTGDTLYFSYTDGDFKDCSGTRSSTGKYNVFTITTTVYNRGEAQADRVKATLLAPEGVMLDVGETAIKEVGNMLVSGSTTVSWNIKPIRQKSLAERDFVVQLNSDNDTQRVCMKPTWIAGAPKNAVVTMPKDPVGRYGDKITVPITIDPTIGKDVYVYKLNVRFNPALVRFVDVFSTGTLTEHGWSGPRAQLFAESGTGTENIVRVQDYTTGSTLNTKTDGVLVALVFEAVLGGSRDKQMQATSDSLVFLRSFDATVSGVPRTLYSSINSADDESEGDDVQVDMVDGIVTVSGDCIIPLAATGAYDLAQNKPNPFNPTTTIEYDIPVETAVSLKVFDHLGRDVATLVNARQKAGRYAVIFDGGNLPSGAYFYRLETPSFTKTLRMVLTR